MAGALAWCWRRNGPKTKSFSFLYPFYVIQMSFYGKSTGLKLAKERPKNEKYLLSVSLLSHSNVSPWQEHWSGVGEGTNSKRKVSRFYILFISFQVFTWQEHWPEVGEGTTPKRKMSRYRVVSISE